MKSYFAGLLFFSLAAAAAPTPTPKTTTTTNKVIEYGVYEAVDVDSGTVKATLDMRADGTVQFSVSTPDFQMPAPGCDGTYTITGEILKAHVNCPIIILPEANVEIDLTTVNPQSIRSQDGALVPVIIDALGTDPSMFKLKIVQKK